MLQSALQQLVLFQEHRLQLSEIELQQVLRKHFHHRQIGLQIQILKRTFAIGGQVPAETFCTFHKGFQYKSRAFLKDS